MTLLQRIGHWGDTHHPRWMDIVRIALGAFLVYKGIEFLQNMTTMTSLLSENLSFSSFALLLIGHYVVSAHILGGLLMVGGILTRFACLIQIPVLLGAVILVNPSADNIWKPFSEWYLAVLVLLLLIYFLVAGNGPWSFQLTEETKESRRNRNH
jgi:putative oxidoreductase